MKKVIALFLTILLGLSMIACSGSSIIGSWESEDTGEYFTFSKEGTLAVGEDYEDLYQYEILDDSTLIVRSDFLSDGESMSYELDGDTLFLDGTAFNKVK